MNTKTNFNEEYYIVYGDQTPGIPTIIAMDNPDIDDELMREDPFENVDAIAFQIDDPRPKNPVMADYLDDGILGVVSQKLYDVLQPMDIATIQLPRATILDAKKKTTYDKYYFLHNYTRISCLDKSLSEYKVSRVGSVRSIEKMVLDKDILSKIQMEDRLIFRLAEMNSYQLFHQSVVDTIMAANPTGIRFVKVSDFNSGSAFD